MNILDFPDELIEHILGLLDPEAVQCCQQTCRKMRSLIADSLFLTYLHTLGLFGYTLPAVPRSDLTLEECVSLLQEHRRGWSRNTAPAPTKVELERQVWPSLVIRYSGGVFAYNYPLAYPYIAGSLRFYQLASKNIGVESKQWTFENIVPAENLNILDYWFDPAYDLLILLAERTDGYVSENSEYRVYLRTMDTNTTHPWATEPVLSAYLPERTVSLCGPGSFEVLGDLLVVRFWGRSSWIVIWDWCRGVEVTRLSLCHVFTFALLSQEAILIPRYLQTYDRSQSPSSDTLIEGVHGSLDVYTFDPFAQHSTAPRLVASFLLPPLSDVGYDGSRLVIVREYGPTSTAASQPPQPKVYEWSPRRRWITVHVTLDGGELSPSAGILCVPHDLFLDMVHRELPAYISNTGQSEAPCPLTIPWGAWGHCTVWASKSIGETHEITSMKDALVGNRLVVARGPSDREDCETNEFAVIDLDQVYSRSKDVSGRRDPPGAPVEAEKVGGGREGQFAQRIFCNKGGSMPTSSFERFVHLGDAVPTRTNDDVFVDSENCEHGMHSRGCNI